MGQLSALFVFVEAAQKFRLPRLVPPAVKRYDCLCHKKKQRLLPV